MVLKITAARLAEIWRTKARIDGYDYTVAIDGRKSSGKTTLAEMLAFHYSGSDLNNSFMDMVERKTVYTATLDEQLERVKSLYRTLPRYDAFIVDEAKEFFKTEWQKEGVRKLIKLMGEVRKITNDEGENVGNKMMVMCQDNFLDFPKGIRDGFNIWIRIMARGVGAVFMPDPTPSYDKWHIDAVDKEKRSIIGQKGKLWHFLNINTQLKLYSSFPTFVGIVTYPPMPSDAEAIYLKKDGEAKDLKHKGDNDLSRRELKHKLRSEMLLSYLRDELKVSLKDVASFSKKYGLPESEGALYNALSRKQEAKMVKISGNN